MGHGFATLGGRARRPIGGGTGLAALSLLAVLAVLANPRPPLAFAAEDPVGEEPSGDTLLPPEGGMSIVPTDEGRDRPEPARTPPDDDRPGGGGGTATGPAAVVAWGLAVAASLAATAVGLGRVRRSLHAWRSPASLAAAGFEPAAGRPTTSFSLLVPAERADPRLAATLDRLAGLDHPSFEVMAVVGYDDLAGRSAAVAAAARHPHVQLHIDRQVRAGRAARLNAAVDACRGQVVGVFGPGDEVHPRLLRHVDAGLADPAVGAVQGGVRQVAGEGRRRWFTARSVVDQYFWSRSRLPFHAHQRFTPLAGTTVFVRGRVLRDVGGWDETSADEAADLGLRLSVRGVPVTVAYDPELATRTPAPRTLPTLLAAHRARVRGTLQVLGRGVWRDLPTRRQRLRARAMLARPLVEAVTPPAVTAAALVAVVAGAPPAALALALLPVVAVPVALGAEVVGLVELGRLDGRRARLRDVAWLVASFVPYQLVVAAAGLAALVDQRPGAGAGRPAPMPVAPPAGRRSGPDRLDAQLLHDAAGHHDPAGDHDHGPGDHHDHDRGRTPDDAVVDITRSEPPLWARAGER